MMPDKKRIASIVFPAIILGICLSFAGCSGLTGSGQQEERGISEEPVSSVVYDLSETDPPGQPDLPPANLDPDAEDPISVDTVLQEASSEEDVPETFSPEPEQPEDVFPVAGIITVYEEIPEPEEGSLNRDGLRTSEELQTWEEPPGNEHDDTVSEIDDTGTTVEDYLSETGYYVVNINTHRIHSPTCNDVKKILPQNLRHTDHPESIFAIDPDYRYCGHCHGQP